MVRPLPVATGGAPIVFDDRNRRRRLEWLERTVQEHGWGARWPAGWWQRRWVTRGAVILGGLALIAGVVPVAAAAVLVVGIVLTIVRRGLSASRGRA